MTPLDFLDFRDLLVARLGLPELQFRLIETRLGLRAATTASPSASRSFEAGSPPRTGNALRSRARNCRR